MSKRKRDKEKSTFDLLKSIRGSWGGVNPITRVVESKKNKPIKHKKKEMEKEQDE